MPQELSQLEKKIEIYKAITRFLMVMTFLMSIAIFLSVLMIKDIKKQDPLAITQNKSPRLESQALGVVKINQR